MRSEVGKQKEAELPQRQDQIPRLSSVDPFIKKIHDRPIGDRYILSKRLGEGRFGSVWLGKCLGRIQVK
jgi:hypothetical protein